VTKYTDMTYFGLLYC